MYANRGHQSLFKTRYIGIFSLWYTKKHCSSGKLEQCFINYVERNGGLDSIVNYIGVQSTYTHSFLDLTDFISTTAIRFSTEDLITVF